MTRFYPKHTTGETMTEFQAQLTTHVREAIRQAKQDGTVGMSLDCLRANVRPPSASLPGAPQGTNAQWAYAQIFLDVVNSCPGFRRFII